MADYLDHPRIAQKLLEQAGEIHALRAQIKAAAEGEAWPVAGFCPMGCGQTLACTSAGAITCHHPDCTRPRALTELLAVDEPDHTVWFDTDSFTVLHPLRERLDNRLVTCALHAHCAALPGPPADPGRYRAWTAASGHWRFEHLGPLTEKEHGRG